MKKEYFKPEIEELEIETSVLANSFIEIDPDTPVVNPDANQNRGEWGNIWK